jgi:hypothetical protein
VGGNRRIENQPLVDLNPPDQNSPRLHLEQPTHYLSPHFKVHQAALMLFRGPTWLLPLYTAYGSFTHSTGFFSSTPLTKAEGAKLFWSGCKVCSSFGSPGVAKLAVQRPECHSKNVWIWWCARGKFLNIITDFCFSGSFACAHEGAYTEQSIVHYSAASILNKTHVRLFRLHVQMLLACCVRRQIIVCHQCTNLGGPLALCRSAPVY